MNCYAKNEPRWGVQVISWMAMDGILTGRAGGGSHYMREAEEALDLPLHEGLRSGNKVHHG